MKRFWTDVAVAREADGLGIMLDGRPVRTPARAALLVPSEALADAIADEWREAPADFDPRTMAMTGLANAAVDRIGPERDTFAAGLSRYVESDLLAYRAENPAALVERQALAWDPLLQWARRRYDIDFAVTQGVSFVAQPDESVRRLHQVVASLDAFRLAGLSPLVTIGGSLIAALAVVEGDVTPAVAWAAVTVDEAWQFEHWGEDADARTALDHRERDFLAGARFLSLLG